MRKSFNGLHGTLRRSLPRYLVCVLFLNRRFGSHQADPLGSGRIGDLDEAVGTGHSKAAASAGRRPGRDRRNRFDPMIGGRTGEQKRRAVRDPCSRRVKEIVDCIAGKIFSKNLLMCSCASFQQFDYHQAP